MLRWLLAEWFARLNGDWNSLIPRDVRHRYVSRAGVAYEVNVEPVPGCLNAVEVTLRGDPVIPHTAMPGLTLVVKPTAVRVGAAIRYLLYMADRLSATMQKLEEEYPVEVIPEPQITPEQTEAIAALVEQRVVESLTQPSAEDLAE